MLRRALRAAKRQWWLGTLIACVLIAALAELRAQPAPGEGTLVLAADQALGGAMRAGDKSSARRLLSLEFSYIDENGKIHARKAFLGDLKGAASGPATGTAVKLYGLVAMVTGHHRSAAGDDAFFIDIWVKEKRAWRALAMQETVLGTAPASPAAAPQSPAPPAIVATSDCKNPCLTIPYRVRSPAEQDIVNSFQAIEKAAVLHDADAWSKHVADEFVRYASAQPPVAKSERVETIRRQKKSNEPVAVGEVQAMRLDVYGDGAAMLTTSGLPNNSRPPYRTARVWAKRNGQWQMAISVRTEVK